MSYGKMFSLMRMAADQEWQAYTKHEFISQLSSGKLPEEKFFNYLIQDYLFLIQFSKAWALAVAKADNLEEMKLCAGTLNGLINFEIDSHIKLCASYGIPQSQIENADEKHNNIAYTRYVLESGYSGDFLDLITPLIPCLLGYAEIGKNIAHCKPEKQMYQTWIDTYSGAEYQSLSSDVGALFDRSVDLRLGVNFEDSYKWASLKKKFIKATALEIDFWEMALR